VLAKTVLPAPMKVILVMAEHRVQQSERSASLIERRGAPLTAEERPSGLRSFSTQRSLTGSLG
ncbi:MAG: hypothetical protein N2545_04090, partial [Thermoflexales bacterium]|nr:hypothetical protein [Thermoflexales bacterium]